MRNLGKKKPGSTFECLFGTYDSNDPAASVTMSGLAVTGIEIYKNGSMTQRASDSGYSLIDTDGIDLDSTTGVHGFAVDLADNSDSGFYAAGGRYWVVVNGMTVDGGAVSLVYGYFEIGYDGSILDTTIATLASQVSFTLTAGPGDNDALNNCPVIVHDIASAVQMCVGYVSDYVGSTRTVALKADPAIFTMAAGDNISVMMPANVGAYGGIVQTDDPPTAAENRAEMDSNSTQLAAIVADTNELQTDDIPGTLTSMDGKIDVIDGNVDAILVDTGTDIPATLSTIAGYIDTEVGTIITTINTIAGYIDTEVAAIKAVTDNLPDAGALTTLAGNIDAILVDTGTTLPDSLLGYFKLTLRDDAAVATDRATELTAINSDEGSGAGSYDNTALSALLGGIDVNVSAILVDTGTDIPATLSTIAGYIDTEVGTIITTINTIAGYIDTEVAAIKVVTDNLPDAGALTTLAGNIDAILVDTGTTLPGLIAALNNLDADGVWDEVIEGTLTARQIVRVVLSALAGILVGAATTTITTRDQADSKDRITATVDADGNRSAVSVDGS